MRGDGLGLNAWWDGSEVEHEHDFDGNRTFRFHATCEAIRGPLRTKWRTRGLTRRYVDVIACVKLDRLARSVHHLVAMVREFEALGVDLVVLDQAIDTTTPAGRLLFHVLAAISEFERDLIRDRVLAGLKRAKAQGVRLGRPRVAVDVLRARAMLAEGESLRQVAKALHVALATLARAVPKTSGRAPRVSARQVAGA